MCAWANYPTNTAAKKNQKKKHTYVNSRRCPKCDTPQINTSGRSSDGRILLPTMTCSARDCDQVYCFYHSNSHVGSTCLEYEANVAAATRLNEAYLSKHTKPCPQCKTSVQKSGGCNQMKCTKCGVHFCWLCNRRVDSGTFPSHFQWWNVGGCPNMQMNESIEPSRLEVTRSKVRLCVIIMCV